MENYREVDGDLIKLALEGSFDVISHGCNCHCTMLAGIAPQMANAFGCNNFNLEDEKYKWDFNKLGQIDFDLITKTKNNIVLPKPLYVVNSYTQFNYGTLKPVDYDAIRLCMRKINYIFKGKHIGLPYVIGCGLAGGDINIVLPIIKYELRDMDITMVKFNK